MPDDAKAAKAPVPPVPDKTYWLVVVKDELDAAPQCIRCENAESLERAISEYVLGSVMPLHAFAFEGARIDISSPRPVCSFQLDGKKFDVGQNTAEFDEGGRIVPLTVPKDAK